MGLIVASRVMTRVGAIYIRTARDLATSAYRSRIGVKHQVINGFLLRATGRWQESEGPVPMLEKGSYIAAVIDMPGFILYAGALRLPQANVSIVGVAVPVGNRDDFVSPGTSVEYQVLDKTGYYILAAPSRIRGSNRPVSYGRFPAIQQREWFFGYSRLDVPLLKNPPDRTEAWLDDDQYFDYSCEVALTGSINSFLTAGRAASISGAGIESGELRLNYFLRNQYAIDEVDLPAEWKLYPRRLVPVDQSATEFASRRAPSMMMSGFAMIPAFSSSALVGVDRYCHAARTFRQHQVPWGEAGSLGYDRYGEQGLLFATGEQDRSEYKPAIGTNLFAETTDMIVVVPTDIEQTYLHPTPEKLPSDSSGRPELPNFGTFFTPTPVQAGDGFVVFSAYTTYRDLDDSESDSRLSGDAWSILTTLPGGRTVSLRADWNAPDGEIETGVAGEFMQPWIVGAATVPTPGSSTAYCLVWEQTYERGGVRRIRGEWALYSSTGNEPSRRVISGGAPLFAVWMQDGPTKFDNTNWDEANPFSSVYHAGENKLITACIDYPPSTSARSIRCAVFDVNNGSVRIGGEIAVSSNYLDKCFVTVVQPFLPATGDAPGAPAVLLATISEHSSGNNGSGGKTYLSLDGGENWREYVTDAGAQGGAFYVGNKMWRFDLSVGLDGRSRV
jgi:hypothetical protein